MISIEITRISKEPCKLRNSCVVFLVLSCFLLNSCGLQVLPRLFPPSNPRAEEILQTFSFQEPQTVDNSVFKGYEIYYKFYDKSAEGQKQLTSKQELINNGFVRLSSESETTSTISEPIIPVLPIDRRSLPHKITFMFNLETASDDPLVEAELDFDRDGIVSGVEQIKLRRGIAGVFGDFQRFSDCSSFKVTDNDVNEVFDQLEFGCSGEQVQLQFYVLSFGMDGIATEIFSQALFLGSILFYFP